ncbi:MAG: hypothetical protein HN348_13835, partial [Proteobacteria bacterium]|nr:hypothetical protein [Pseudomonadota bacterium]
MIFNAASLDLPLTISTDLCVIGSGAGGSMVAKVAAEAGMAVTVLETGAFVPPPAMTQREEEMLPQLLWAGGGQTSTNRGVKIHQGKGVGGSTLHNINLCKRLPEPLRAEWSKERGLKHLPPSRWTYLYDQVESLLEVSTVPESEWSRHNLILQKGCDKLGWRGGGLAHNRTGCIGSGFCLLGCTFDAKNNAAKMVLPPAIRAGAQILTHCQAVRLRHAGQRVLGVEAAVLDPFTRKPIGEVYIESPKVCLSASATGTPAILLRSKVPDPGNETGNTLRIHPALVAAGEFDEPVRGYAGIPQTFDCTQFLNFDSPAEQLGNRTWIVTAFAHPAGTASMMPGFGAKHREMMARYS